jgi:hypothetical protein
MERAAARGRKRKKRRVVIKMGVDEKSAARGHLVIENHILGEINPCPNFADVKQYKLQSRHKTG